MGRSVSRLSERERLSLAGGSDTPARVLAELAEDEEWHVRGCVAKNPNAPESVLAKLADDSLGRVRWWVAANPNTPGNVLAQLACDEDENVAELASRALAWATLCAAGATVGLSREEFIDVE